MNTLRDSRQNIHSIAFRYIPKSLCMNTLRNFSQDIHSIILRGKVLRTKELWGGARLGPPVLALDRFSKTEAEPPEGRRSRRRSLAPAHLVYFSEGIRAQKKTRLAKRR